MWLFCLTWKLISLAGVLHRDAGNIPLAIKAYEQCLHIDLDSRNAGQVCKQHWLISRFWDPIIHYCMIWNICMHHTFLTEFSYCSPESPLGHELHPWGWGWWTVQCTQVLHGLHPCLCEDILGRSVREFIKKNLVCSHALYPSIIISCSLVHRVMQEERLLLFQLKLLYKLLLGESQLTLIACECWLAVWHSWELIESWERLICSKKLYKAVGLIKWNVYSNKFYVHQVFCKHLNASAY